MSLNNVVKDIDQISNSAWTYGDLMEAESRILKALQQTLSLDPNPNLNRLCKEPISLKLNLNIPGIRRKRLRQIYGVVTLPNNQTQSNLDNKAPEKSNLRVGESRLIIQQPDFGTQEIVTSQIQNAIQNQDSRAIGIAMEKEGIRFNPKQEPVVTSLPVVNWRSKSNIPVISGIGSPCNEGNMIDKSMVDRFSRIQMWTTKLQLNRKKNKIDEYKRSTNFPTQHLAHCLHNDDNNNNDKTLKDETCQMQLSKSLVGGSMNVCKTRVLKFVKADDVSQENGASLKFVKADNVSQELQIFQQQQQAQNQRKKKKKMMMMERNTMGMGQQITSAQAAAVMADRMVQQSKTNASRGHFGNIIGLSMMSYGSMNQQQQLLLQQESTSQSFRLPPQQVSSSSPWIGMPHQQPVMSPRISYGAHHPPTSGGNMDFLGGQN